MKTCSINLEAFLEDLVESGHLYSTDFMEPDVTTIGIDGCKTCGGVVHAPGPPYGCVCKHNKLLESIYANIGVENE